MPNDHSTLLARAMTVQGFRKTALPDITQTSEGRSPDPFRIKWLHCPHFFFVSKNYLRLMNSGFVETLL